MANYKVIGGDLKQYGPVSAEDLRKWIADGRLNAMSLAQVHGEIEWKPLSSFPEFADALPDQPATPVPPLPSSPTAGGGREAALRKVKTPAIGLMITAIINIALAVYGLVERIFFPPSLQEILKELQPFLKFMGSNSSQIQQSLQQSYHMMGPFGIVSSLFQLVLSALILTGAIKMQSLRSYEFAMTAAILSLIPCLTPCCGYPLGLLFGIWSLAVLPKPGVKSQFH